MSAGAVIKYSMTLDGAQYISELRSTIAATKEAEKAIADEAKAMGVITVSAKDAKEILAKSGEEANALAGSMSGAMQATRGFNAVQSAFAQAMSGNFVGAMRSGTVAVNSLKAAMMSNPFIAAIAAITGAIALLVIQHQRAAKAADEQATAEANLQKAIAGITGTDPASIAAEYANRMVENGDQAGLMKARDAAFAKKLKAEENARAWGMQAAADPGDAAIVERAARGLEKLREAQAIAEIYAGAIDKIKTADAAFQKYEDTGGGEKIAAYHKRIADDAEKRRQSGMGELERLERQKKLLEEDLASNTGSRMGLAGVDLLNREQDIRESIAAKDAEISAQKKKAQELELEYAQKLRDIEIQRAEIAAGRSKDAADISAKELEAAKNELLHPGAAAKAERDAERERLRDENRLRAAMSGNSIQARAAREQFDAKWFADWAKQDQAALDQNRLDLAKEERDNREAQQARDISAMRKALEASLYPA